MNGKVALGISRLAFAVGILNFGIFALEYGYFGGTASGGKVEGDRFFLHHKSPREELRYVQVSESVFRYSVWHESTIGPGMVAAMAAGANIYRIRARRAAA